MEFSKKKIIRIITESIKEAFHARDNVVNEGRDDLPDEDKQREKDRLMQSHEKADGESRAFSTRERLDDLKGKKDANRELYQWGQLNSYLYEMGSKIFVANTRPGSFTGEVLEIPTMVKKRVTYPLRDPKGAMIMDPKTGTPMMGRGWRDVKGKIIEGVFSGPVYTVNLKLKDMPDLGVVTHMTTDHRIYGHAALKRTAKLFDRGVWIKGVVANKLMSSRNDSVGLKLKIMAVEAGLIEDYPFSVVDRKIKAALKL